MSKKKKDRTPLSGTCLLTGSQGKFVKSHIIPKKLTEPEWPGGMLFQHGSGLRAQKRRTSWYGPQIVTRDGEDVLSELDDYAIKTLRRHRLVWSGFGPVKRVECDHPMDDSVGYEGYGVREVTLEDSESLRKFAMSILWRAAVSQLPEMREVSINADESQKLASYITGRSSLSLTVFPVFLTQYPEVGFVHNQTPIREHKTPFPGMDGLGVDIFRFYFDGLVLHFHIVDNSTSEGFRENPMTLGVSDRIYVTCVPWGRSKQLENIVTIARESLW